ncbi:MAG TPA: helix-turn-helix domain-containing protein [Ferruginibacter sp.]|nr:helix-turn-helix domain-containing protein [Ferruginibacter sp.]
MEQLQAQQLFFNHIKSKLPAHLSLVDEVAELLNISNDSAYRRIRGDKPIALDEIQVLCNNYKVSLDQLLQINTDTVIFSGNIVDNETFNLNKYLHDIHKNLEFIKSLPGAEFFCFNKDIPIFYFMQFPELSAFKFFFWKRTILNYPELSKQLFNGEEVDADIQETGKKIINTYSEISSTEIWNEQNIHITIQQIEFYRETRVFANKHIILKVYSQLEELLNHLELQAEKGKKFLANGKPIVNSANYSVYINECLIGDNTYHVKAGEKQMTFINHGGLNFMGTSDKRFCDFTYNNLQNIIRKSSYISVIGEKERSMFFNSLRERIYEKKKNIL